MLSKDDKKVWPWRKIIQLAFIALVFAFGIAFGGKCSETFNNNPTGFNNDPDPIIRPESVEAQGNTDRTIEELQQLIDDLEAEIR